MTGFWILLVVTIVVIVSGVIEGLLHRRNLSRVRDAFKAHDLSHGVLRSADNRGYAKVRVPEAPHAPAAALISSPVPIGQSYASQREPLLFGAGVALTGPPDGIKRFSSRFHGRFTLVSYSSSESAGVGPRWPALLMNTPAQPWEM